MCLVLRWLWVVDCDVPDSESVTIDVKCDVFERIKWYINSSSEVCKSVGLHSNF